MKKIYIQPFNLKKSIYTRQQFTLTNPAFALVQSQKERKTAWGRKMLSNVKADWVFWSGLPCPGADLEEPSGRELVSPAEGK